MIVLFGAEFTQQWAKQRGGGIRPEDGAVQADDNGKAASEVAAAPTTAPAKRGGFGDWIVGLPVLYLIFRGRRGGGRGEG
jgi:hypothetical protein